MATATDSPKMQIIYAQLHHPEAPESFQQLYCFDAPEHQLVAEPFVTSASNAIHMALRWHLGYDHFMGTNGYERSEAVQLVFTSDERIASTLAEQDEALLHLTLIEPSNGGHLYHWELVHPESAMDNQDWEHDIFYEPAWLCPALLKYFPEGAPAQFWVQVKETSVPSRKE